MTGGTWPAVRRRFEARGGLAGLSVCSLLGCVVLACGASDVPETSPGEVAAVRPPLRVTVTAAPLAWWAEELGGAAVQLDLRFVVHDQHSWSPTPDDVGALAEADCILLQGSGYEGWRDGAVLPDSRVVETSNGLDLIALAGRTHSHGAAGEHSHVGVDPHLWYDPALLARQGEVVATILERHLPDEVAAIRGHLEQRRAALEALGVRLARLGEDTSRAWVVASPDLKYLTRALGVEALMVADEDGVDRVALERAKGRVLAAGQRPILLRLDTDAEPADAVWPGADVVTVRSVEALEASGAPVSPLTALTAAVEQLENLASS
jgi:zinc transport system substrate-binding protein